MIIAAESAYGSTSNTGWLLQKLSLWLFGYADPMRFKVFHHMLRKSGHFLGYGIFGYFWFRAFMRTLAGGIPLMWAALAIASVFLVASLDELHQSVLPGRTGQFSDVMLDTAGALAFVAVALFAVTVREKPTSSNTH
jgi:VanZ family protein